MSKGSIVLLDCYEDNQCWHLFSDKFQTLMRLRLNRTGQTTVHGVHETCNSVTFFYEIKCDGIMWRNYKFAWNSCSSCCVSHQYCLSLPMEPFRKNADQIFMSGFINSGMCVTLVAAPLGFPHPGWDHSALLSAPICWSPLTWCHGELCLDVVWIKLKQYISCFFCVTVCSQDIR